ncbi:MAG: hypothetical protein NC453_23085 [Muribaculum sp.]|nr:hypothetical protein [Muribaculum sp.]
MAQNDFIVFVPARAWAKLAEIKAMVDKYKLISKRAHYVKIGNPVIIGGSDFNADVITIKRKR